MHCVVLTKDGSQPESTDANQTRQETEQKISPANHQSQPSQQKEEEGSNKEDGEDKMEDEGSQLNEKSAQPETNLIEQKEAPSQKVEEKPSQASNDDKKRTLD